MQSVVAQRDVTIAKMIKAHKQSFDAKKPARDLLDQFFLDQVSVPMSRTHPDPIAAADRECTCAHARTLRTTRMVRPIRNAVKLWRKSAVASLCGLAVACPSRAATAAHVCLRPLHARLQLQPGGLTDDEIHVVIWDIIFGGTDTTATTVEWMIYWCINYPAVQKKMQQVRL